MVSRTGTQPINSLNNECRADNDMFHHLNNPIYGVLIDSIINQYLFENTGYNTVDYPRTALVASSYCDFFGSLAYPGVIELGLRVVNLGKNSVMYEVGFFEQGEEAVKAVGGFTQIWVKREDGRPPPEGLEPHVRKGLKALMGGKKEDGKASRL